MDSAKRMKMRKGAWGLITLAVLLCGVLLPLKFGVERRLACLWVSLALECVALAICGIALDIGPWGVFIDSRNRVSLSRVQWVLWTIVLLGGLSAAVMSNVAAGDRDPADVTIPNELLVLAGISATSMIGATTIRAMQRGTPQVTSVEAKEAEAKKSGRDPTKVRVEGTLAVNTDVRDASWTDLIEGERADNFATVDIGKAQMLAITLLTVSVYVASLARLFADPDVAFIGRLPDITEGLNVLLGMSHAGYLVTKGLSAKKDGVAG